MKKFLTSLVLVLVLPLAIVLAGCGKDLQGIRVDISDVKVDYIVGETFSSTSLKVYARYKDGETELATGEFEVDLSGVDKDTVGSYDVVVKFQGKTKTFKIHYYTKGTMTVASNNKYFKGQSFEGAHPDVVYTSGKGEISHLIDEYTIKGGFDSSEAGEVSVTLVYNGYEYETTVTVLEDEDYKDYILGLLVEGVNSFDLNGVERISSEDGVEDVKYYCHQYIYHGDENSQVWITPGGYVYTASGDSYTMQNMPGNIEETAEQLGLSGVNYIDIEHLNAYYAELVTSMIAEVERLVGDGYQMTISQSYDSLTFTFVKGEDSNAMTINVVGYSVSSISSVYGQSQNSETLNGSDYHEIPEPQGGWQAA